MLLSVVIPTFNRAHLIGAAVASAIGEAGEDGEVIVVDDGSTDDTAAALARFGGAIRTIRQANAGASHARNTGLTAARGRFVRFADSDDLIPPGALRALIGCAQAAGPRDIVLGDAECLYDDGRTAPGAAHGYGYAMLGRAGPLGLTDLLTGGMQTSLPLFPRAALAEVGGFDAEVRLGEEKELALRLHARGWRFSRVPLTVVRMGIHAGPRLSAGKEPAALDNLIASFAKMLALLEGMEDVPRSARVALARTMWGEARDAARAGHAHHAATVFAAARALGGADAAVGGRAMRALYRLTTPIHAERLAEAAKRLAGRRVSSPAR